MKTPLHIVLIQITGLLLATACLIAFGYNGFLEKPLWVFETSRGSWMTGILGGLCMCLVAENKRLKLAYETKDAPEFPKIVGIGLALGLGLFTLMLWGTK